jgi:hypothetical protein
MVARGQFTTPYYRTAVQQDQPVPRIVSTRQAIRRRRNEAIGDSTCVLMPAIIAYNAMKRNNLGCLTLPDT